MRGRNAPPLVPGAQDVDIVIETFDDLFATTLPEPREESLELTVYLEQTYILFMKAFEDRTLCYDTDLLYTWRKAWTNYRLIYYDSLKAYTSDDLVNTATVIWMCICAANIHLDEIMRPVYELPEDWQMSADDSQFLLDQEVVMYCDLPVMMYSQYQLIDSLKCLADRWIHITEPHRDLRKYLTLLEYRASVLLVRSTTNEQDFDVPTYRQVHETGRHPWFACDPEFASFTGSMFHYFARSLRTYFNFPREPATYDNLGPQMTPELERDGQARVWQQVINEFGEKIQSENAMDKFKSMLERYMVRPGEWEERTRAAKAVRPTLQEVLLTCRPVCQIMELQDHRFKPPIKMLDVVRNVDYEPQWVRDFAALRIINTFFQSNHSTQFMVHFVQFENTYEKNLGHNTSCDYPIIVHSFHGWDVLYWRDLGRDDDQMFMMDEDRPDEKVMFSTRTIVNALALWLFFVWRDLGGEVMPEVNLMATCLRIYDPVVQHQPAFVENAFKVTVK